MTQAIKKVTTVALNCAILERGISGTATGVEAIARALTSVDSIELRRVYPRFPRQRSSIQNAWMQASWDLGRVTRTEPAADVLVSPCNIGRSRRQQRHVLVMHDTMVLDYPERFDRGYVLYARALFGFSALRANAIVTPSEYSRSRIIDRWPSAPPPVVARWPVVARVSEGRTSPMSKDVLMVGATEPHKRHSLGIAAVEKARGITGLDIRLRIIGPEGRAEGEVYANSKHHEWITREVGLPAEDLDRAYSKALCLLQPSLSEGYGLPVAEAAAWALPSLHSGLGALAEIAPGQVEQPEQPKSYANSIAELATSSSRYSESSQASLRSAGLLSQDAFAGPLLTAVQAVD